MKKNIMPMIGKNLETLGRAEYNRWKTVYITEDDFKKKLDEKEYDIIAVALNDIFIDNFLPKKFNKGYYLIDNKYFIFNTEGEMEQTGGFTDSLLKEHLVDTLYIITPSLQNIMKDMVNNVMTLSEAATKWGLTEGALRKAISFHRFKVEEYRKAGRITLITKEGMERVYGRIKLRKLEKVTYKEMERFIIDNMESNYNVINVLSQEVGELENGCEMIFEMYDCKFKITREVKIIDEENEIIEDLYDVEKLYYNQ